jgi:hypothetical protein
MQKSDSELRNRGHCSSCIHVVANTTYAYSAYWEVSVVATKLLSETQIQKSETELGGLVYDTQSLGLDYGTRAV